MPDLIKFGAEWCIPCQRMAPVLSQLAEKMPGLVVTDVDVDEIGELRKEWEVDSVPVFFYIDESRGIYRRHNGSMPPVKLLEFIS